MKISTTTPTSQPPAVHDKLRSAAIELEAAFLTEMLKSAGLGQSRESFGGGTGEDQFTSFLVQQQARQMAEAGGVGLSEILFRSLMEGAHADKA